MKLFAFFLAYFFYVQMATAQVGFSLPAASDGGFVCNVSFGGRPSSNPYGIIIGSVNGQAKKLTATDRSFFNSSAQWSSQISLLNIGLTTELMGAGYAIHVCYQGPLERKVKIGNCGKSDNNGNNGNNGNDGNNGNNGNNNGNNGNNGGTGNNGSNGDDCSYNSGIGHGSDNNNCNKDPNDDEDIPCFNNENDLATSLGESFATTPSQASGDKSKTIDLSEKTYTATTSVAGSNFFYGNLANLHQRTIIKCDLRKAGTQTRPRGKTEARPAGDMEVDFSYSTNWAPISNTLASASTVINSSKSNVPRFCEVIYEFKEMSGAERPNFMRDTEYTLGLDIF